MMAAPTIITYSPAFADANWYDANANASRLASVFEPCANGFRCVVNVSSSAGSQHFIHWTADARLV